MTKRIILLLLILAPFQLLAQNFLTGNVFDNENRATSIEGAAIKNLTTKAFTLSDKDGHFAITAKIGDLVSFGMPGFQTDTVYLVNLFPKNIYLRVEVNTLAAVDIKGVKISPMLNGLGNPDNKPPVKTLDYSKEKGGLRLNLGYGRWRKDQAKIQELEENDRIQQEITKNFNAETVKEILKFEGPDVKDFLSLYRPTVDQVKAEKPFNYSYYTATAYRAWLKLPADQRKLPPLPKLKGN
ncbi:hypothetical protein EZ428_20405 [Pedobacter frigiditerrae]|uniref:CarboxypepD_reg-like domain-containing protein n=1 Tax=Pedobacter frigiditerrae TaxID=2530452 RepID=A0A4V2MHW4_9SPHI|nr:hypothetical protein [Pedobacter frigiditerrae]TCC88086.1 hypothetical protein EZ428_20405 [Pedobacter frigiditerrae]